MGGEERRGEDEWILILILILILICSQDLSNNVL